MPSAAGCAGWPGTAITSRPSSRAALAVERAPLRFPASTTTTARAQPAITRLRRGKFCFHGPVRSGNSLTRAPSRATASARAAFSAG